MFRCFSSLLIFLSFVLSCTLPVQLEKPNDDKLSISEAKRLPSRMNYEPLKILIIGNSWSENSTDDLGLILDNLGYKVDLNRTYLGNASLRDYSNNLATRDSILTYSSWQDDKWIKSECKLCLDDVIDMKEWDVITLQQRSKNSVSYTTYQPYLNILLNKIYSLDVVPLVYYHVTWSYPHKTELNKFPVESMSTESMYDEIIKTWSRICRETNNYNVILSTPVIQQSRRIECINASLFDTEDGLHLFEGKYAAACAWASTFIQTYYDPSVRDKEIFDCTYYGPYSEEVAKSIQMISYNVASNINDYMEFNSL